MAALLFAAIADVVVGNSICSCVVSMESIAGGRAWTRLLSKGRFATSASKELCGAAEEDDTATSETVVTTIAALLFATLVVDVAMSSCCTTWSTLVVEELADVS